MVTLSKLPIIAFRVPGASADKATAWSVRVDNERHLLYVAVAHSAVAGYTPAQAHIIALDISPASFGDSMECPKVTEDFEVGTKPQTGANFQWTLHEIANDAAGEVYGATVDAPSWAQATVRFSGKAV